MFRAWIRSGIRLQTQARLVPRAISAGGDSGSECNREAMRLPCLKVFPPPRGARMLHKRKICTYRGRARAPPPQQQ